MSDYIEFSIRVFKSMIDGIRIEVDDIYPDKDPVELRVDSVEDRTVIKGHIMCTIDEAISYLEENQDGN